jgi:hypothetical protein
VKQRTENGDVSSRQGVNSIKRDCDGSQALMAFLRACGFVLLTIQGCVSERLRAPEELPSARSWAEPERGHQRGHCIGGEGVLGQPTQSGVTNDHALNLDMITSKG